MGEQNQSLTYYKKKEKRKKENLILLGKMGMKSRIEESTNLINVNTYYTVREVRLTGFFRKSTCPSQRGTANYITK